MLQKNKTPRSWINKQLKQILVAVSIAIFLILTAIPFTAVLRGVGTDVATTVNALLLIVILAITVTMCVEGYRVMKLVKNMDIQSNSTSQDVLETITKIVVGSSAALIVTMIVLIITTLIRIAYPHSVIGCLIMHLIYRMLELTLIAILTIPLRGFEIKTPNSTSKDARVSSQTPSKSESNSQFFVVT